YREFFGIIIGRFRRSYAPMTIGAVNSRPMNNIMDLSDDFEGFQLGQFTPNPQKLVKQMLYKSSVTEQTAEFGCELEEDGDRFLARVIKELDDTNAKKYLYIEERCSKADYIVKIYGPIMENLFRASGCNLIWK
ncbi:hypothetical protein CU098_005393, partial [Rhizopus stolonifer]